MKRLSELCCNDSNSSKFDTIKLVIVEQLRSFAEKLEKAFVEDTQSYNDLIFKITNIIEEFCVINFDKEVNYNLCF